MEVTLVELKDIQLPDSVRGAMARQAEAEREERAKSINAEGESLVAAALGDASDIMTARSVSFQLGTLQGLVENDADKNTTRPPAPLMSTIGEPGAFPSTRNASPPRGYPPRRRPGPPNPVANHGRTARRDPTARPDIDRQRAGPMSDPTTVPPAGIGETFWPKEEFAQIHIVAAHPDTAQRVARLLHQVFVTDEPHSYPSDGGGTRPQLTVDTAREKTSPPAARTWPAASDSHARRTHDEEVS